MALPAPNGVAHRVWRNVSKVLVVHRIRQYIKSLLRRAVDLGLHLDHAEHALRGPHLDRLVPARVGFELAIVPARDAGAPAQPGSSHGAQRRGSVSSHRWTALLGQAGNPPRPRRVLYDKLHRVA